MTQIETILISGADANSCDHEGFSLLMSFAQKGDLESVKALIKYGAHVNKKDLSGFSAMDYAIDANSLEIIEYLVDNGAIVTNDNYMLAIRKNRKVISEYFDGLDSDKHVFLKKRKK
jgi:ankyrin repeat protein